MALSIRMRVTEMISSTGVTAGIPPGGTYGMPESARGEPDETALFLEFLSRHVQRNRSAGVQRMLLWSEWVRFYLKQTNTFPRSLLEVQFNDIMTGKLNAVVVNEDFFGPVYYGIQFVPEKRL